MPPSSLLRVFNSALISHCRQGNKTLLKAFCSGCGKEEPPPCDKCSTGFKQSPIDICPGNAKKIELPPLTFSNHFNDDVNLCMFLSDETVNIVPNATLMSVEGGPLSGVFVLEKCHFHWGCEDTEGTEHSFEKQKYAMEAHLKYYNCLFGSFSKAMNQPDGIAVVSILLQAMPNATNCDFDTVIRCLPSLTPGKTLPITKNVLKMFKNTLDSQKYFTYEGSITMPPCSEEVTWLVFKDVMCVDCNQVAPFRKICGEKGEPITNNCRDTQCLNGRKIYDVSAAKNDCKK